MIRSSQFKDLKEIEEAVISKAKEFNRSIPEIRFFSLDAEEFISLLEKRVYPSSPISIWEGKNVVKKRFFSDIGASSGVYYEVVQTGNPSYAYLNENNTLTTQASVMAHVVGHCEFSELNVMNDSDMDRTEYSIFLAKKINDSIERMGFTNYSRYRNACESMIPLVNSNSQYNLKNSVDSNIREIIAEKKEEKERQFDVDAYSSTLQILLDPLRNKNIYLEDEISKSRKETIDRKGYKLRAPCQDIFGFLKNFAPASSNEKQILDYIYFVAKHHHFVMQTQIMNEGWSMFWEKKIMNELFKEGVCKDVVDYCRVFSGVCSPRPYFMRNPYHLGYSLWTHIEELYRKGKVSIDYIEEQDMEKKENWDLRSDVDPIKKMEHLVRTITDHEFLRRFLTTELIYKFHLNRLTHRMFKKYGFGREHFHKADEKYIWLDPEFVKNEMLMFFSDYGRPMIYLIDADFEDGGLLLYHRHKGSDLREDWIGPTLRNINHIWKSPVSIVTGDKMYKYINSKTQRGDIEPLSFKEIKEKMSDNQKPF